MLKREATAVWRGTGKEGKGEMSTQSGTLKGTQYSFSTRFENGVGTNPEELVGAAHAGCYSMALSFLLSGAGFKPEELRTKATVLMENKTEGWTVTEVQLALEARVPELKEPEFQEFAAKAKAGCPISRLFNTKITLNAKLL